MTSSASSTSTFDFTGSVVLVTGGGTGIGGAITEAFLQAGASVAITGRRKEKLDEALAAHPDERTLAVPADLTDPAQVRQVVADVVEHFGRLDVLVSNAGAHVGGDITEVDDDAFAAMRALNVDGFFHLAKAALPHLEASGGNLVAVSSVSGERGDWGQAAYNATKASVSTFVRSLALDWGRKGVRINAVAPALTLTPLTAGMIDDPDLVAAFENRTAMGRIGQPEDLAGPTLFLASDAAAYVTGVVLPVDGGTMASTGQAHV